MFSWLALLAFSLGLLLTTALPSGAEVWTATWTQKKDSPAGGRAWIDMAFDDVQGRVLLFGGTASGPLNDVWQYDPVADSWVQLEPARTCPDSFTPPTARAEYALDYDPIAQLLWVFGGTGSLCTGPNRVAGRGTTATTIVDRTLSSSIIDFYKGWTVTAGDSSSYVSAFDPNHKTLTLNSPLTGVQQADSYSLYPQRGGGTFWYSPIARDWGTLTDAAALRTEAMPDDRSGAAMAYSLRDGTIVMFGGAGRNDTWLLDTRTRQWTDVTAQVTPPGMAHIANAMVYDSDHDVFILFGGCLCSGDAGPSSDDTWAYRLSTNTWTKLAPAGGPPARQGHSVVYDSRNKVVVLFGGFDGGYDGRAVTYYDDLWVYRFATNTWTQVFPVGSPPPRATGAMVYDSIRQQALLYGGMNPALLRDVWALDLQSAGANAMVAPGVVSKDVVDGSIVQLKAPKSSKVGTAVSVTATSPAPSIKSISPTSALAGGSGTTLTIKGTNFTSSAQVSFNGTKRTPSVSSGQLTVALSAQDLSVAGSYPVAVITSGGSSAAVTFTVNNLVPVITALSPSGVSAGAAARTLTINGKYFLPTSTVTYKGVKHTATFVSSSQITIALTTSDQASVGTYPVVVTNGTPGGGASSAVNFTVAQDPAAAVSSLQPGQWYKVPNSNLSAVLPSPLPPGNPVNIMAAWSGGAYDTTRDRLIVWGGGGSNYAGNEIYTFDITSLRWSRPWGPSPNIPDPLGAPCTYTYSDGNPVARSTYDGVQYAPSVDKFWIQGGSLSCASGAAALDTWTFDFKTSAWARKRDVPQTMLGVTSAYDPVTGHIFLQSSTGFFEYDPVNDTWAKRGAVGISLSENHVRTAAIDPVNRLFVVVGDGEFFAWNLDTSQLLRPSTSGATQIQSSRAPGLVYDPVSKKLIAWAGGATLYGLDTQTWKWTQYSPASSNSVVPTSTPSGGTYGRFQYVPSKNMFVAVNGIYEDVYVYKLTAGTPPAIVALVPASASAGAAAQTLTINGANFTSASTVKYNGAARTAGFVSSGQMTIPLTATDQANAGTYSVVVTNPATGSSSNAVMFTVTNPVPSIAALSPTSSSAGSAARTLTINGSNFLATSTVKYNGVQHTPTFVNSSQLTISLTASDQATGGTYPVVVTNPSPGGGPSNSAQFGVVGSAPTATPAITSLSPASVTAGAAAKTLTINGSNFVSGSTAAFNGAQRTTTFVGSSQLTIPLTASDQATAGTYWVAVTNPGGGVSTSMPFYVVPPGSGGSPAPTSPTLSSQSPGQATAGGASFTLTVTGSNFTGSSVVMWNGATRPTTYVQSTQLKASITSSDIANPGNAQVTVSSTGVVSNALSFSIVPSTATIDSLQAGQWYRVPGSNLSAVLPNPLPPGNPASVMAAWSGGTYDTTRNRLLVWGGGHGDYAGNEIYAFDMNTLAWSRPWGPSPNIPSPLDAPCTLTYSDKNPVARHTYDGLQYAPNVDKLWIQGGSLSCGSGAAGFDTWTFDFTTLSWARKSDIPQTMLGVTSAYDPQTGHIFVQSSTGFFEYDPVGDTWARRGNMGASLSEDHVRTAAIDPVNRVFVAMGDGELFAWNLNNFQMFTPTTSGATQIQSERAPGLVYDPVSKKLIAWAGGATVYGLDTQTWTWTGYDPASTNTVVPTSGTPTGTYGRFQYVPSKNVYVAVNGIYEDVYVYKLTPGGGQVTMPAKQWIALQSPSAWSTQGMPSTLKHVTPAYHPPSGRIYFTGGDYPGPVYSGSVGTTDSYRQETWSLSIFDRFAKPSDPGAGWRLEYPYCGPSGQFQPKHPDYTGLVWDATKSLFYMVPGVMESVTQGDCPGETSDKADNAGFISGKMMTFDPAARQWGILGSGDPGNSQDSWMSVLDPVTYTLIRFGLDLKVSIFDIKNQTWSTVAMPGNANLWKEYLAADIPGRAIYAIDGLLGNLWRYNIDSRTFENLGGVPGGALGITNQTYIAWDSRNKVLFWHKEGSGFYAYHPDTKTWETLSIATNVPNVNATGRLMIYDPVQNLILLYGGTSNPQPYLFFYRYGP